MVDASEHKPTQLASATRAGLSVPDTLFTCDPATGRAFVAEHHDRVVVKALTQRHTTFVPTTRIRLSDDLSGIADTVHFLQALVEDRLFDARVTVVDDQVFTAAIRTNGALDWRPLPPDACDHRPVEAPSEIAKACVEHVRDLGLAYAALDFVVTEDGWTYLETNCAGEFGWIEALTDLPISAALARVLTGDALHTRHTTHRRVRI
ncbi:RimK family alpha-L-glutamate ligase [Embleya sp. NPDC059259]|uniref:ATP-grasp domain-containing protein n=1 Tax=unclassified Embleya TaxID=2699296 RepID=UPI00369C9CC9